MIFTILLAVWLKIKLKSKYCSDGCDKNILTKNLWWLKMLMTFLRTQCWICENDYIDHNIKVRDHCHITEKCKGSCKCKCT